ncbi:MAG TPA: YfhO family protein, partial [Bellilinea sp.]|nr:YfhO family protein [Bellilinea sp.]
LWLTTAVGTVLALGSNTPIFPWLFRHVPTFEMFQAPARWMLWPTLSLAILAGFAADRWKFPGKKGRVVLNLVVFGGLILSAGAWLGSLAMPELEPGLVRGLILFGVTAAVSAFIARRLPTKERLGGWGVAAGIWIALDLLTAQAFLNPTLPTGVFNTAHSQIEQINKTRENGRIWIDPQVEYEIKFKQFFDFTDFHQPADGAAIRESLLPNLNVLDGVPLVNNFDPLLPERYAAWLEWMESAEPQLASKWLTLAGTGAELVNGPQGTQQPILVPLTAGPRVSWTPCVVSAPSPKAAFAAVNQRLETGLDESCIVAEGEITPTTDDQSAGEATVTILEESPNRLLISANATADGWVVIRDSWYPGWQARVDNKPAPILHADYLFKAVSVSAGNHEIELEYKPISFTIGLWVSVFAWVVFSAAWVILRRKANQIPEYQ